MQYKSFIAHPYISWEIQHLWYTKCACSTVSSLPLVHFRFFLFSFEQLIEYLEIGHTWACSQSSGSLSDASDWMYRAVSIWANSLASSWRIRHDIPPGPDALLTLIPCNSFYAWFNDFQLVDWWEARSCHMCITAFLINCERWTKLTVFVTLYIMVCMSGPKSKNFNRKQFEF